MSDNQNLAIPPLGELTPFAARAHGVIVATLKKLKLTHTGDSPVFYSPVAWRAKGEQYGRESELIAVFDGGDHGAAFSYDHACENYSALETMSEALAEVGAFFEAATTWYGSVYRI